MLEIIDLIKIKGFKNVISILDKIPNYTLTRKTFNKKLLEFSNYNSFYRLKEKLIETGIIEIVEFSRRKNHRIRLTAKGILILNKLKTLNKIFLFKNNLKQITFNSYTVGTVESNYEM